MGIWEYENALPAEASAKEGRNALPAEASVKEGGNVKLINNYNYSGGVQI